MIIEALWDEPWAVWISLSTKGDLRVRVALGMNMPSSERNAFEIVFPRVILSFLFFYSDLCFRL